MTVYTWQRYRRDERDTRFRKVCEALGYEPDTMIGGNALDPETHREKLSGLLSRLQLGDVLLIEKLCDLTEVPSEAPPVFTKLAANPATIFVCDLSKSAPVTTYAHIVSSAAQSFVPLEKEIRDLKAELETVNERIADYVSIASEALHQRYAALYKRGPVTLVEELLKPPRDLRDAEPVASDERIVAILEAALAAAFTIAKA